MCSWAHMREKDETWGVGCAALQAAAKGLGSGAKTAAGTTDQQANAAPTCRNSGSGMCCCTGSSSSGVIRLLGSLQGMSLEVGFADL